MSAKQALSYCNSFKMQIPSEEVKLEQLKGTTSAKENFSGDSIGASFRQQCNVAVLHLAVS